MEFTKEDENKLGQILKELNEMRNVLKGGEGSGVKGHKTSPNWERTNPSKLTEQIAEAKKHQRILQDNFENYDPKYKQEIEEENRKARSALSMIPKKIRRTARNSLVMNDEVYHRSK